jgi:hypothetical protein
MSENNSNTDQAKQSCKTGVMPRFFCKKCNTHIGCSYENFGVFCSEELKFKQNIMETFYSKIDKRLKDLKKQKELLFKNAFFKIGVTKKIRDINLRINELNRLLDE